MMFNKLPVRWGSVDDYYIVLITCGFHEIRGSTARLLRYCLTTGECNIWIHSMTVLKQDQWNPVIVAKQQFLMISQI